MQHLMEDSAIDLAVKRLRNGKYKSVPEVATGYGLHRSTLYRRLKNQATLKEARVAQQILTPAQEERVVRVIESLQRVHVVMTNDMVLAIAACVAQQHTGRQWLQRFYRRQTSLTLKPNPPPAARFGSVVISEKLVPTILGSTFDS